MKYQFNYITRSQSSSEKPKLYTEIRDEINKKPSYEPIEMENE